MLKLASRTGHVGRGKEGEREIPDVWFVFFLKEQFLVIMNQKYKISLKLKQLTEYG